MRVELPVDEFGKWLADTLFHSLEVHFELKILTSGKGCLSILTITTMSF